MFLHRGMLVTNNGALQWSADLEEKVMEQAVFSHLRGGEKLCGL